MNAETGLGIVIVAVFAVGCGLWSVIAAAELRTPRRPQ